MDRPKQVKTVYVNELETDLRENVNIGKQYAEDSQDNLNTPSTFHDYGTGIWAEFIWQTPIEMPLQHVFS